MKFFNWERRAALDRAISNLERYLETLPKDSPEYTKATCDLKTLCEARAVVKQSGINKNEIIRGVFAVATLLIGLNFEKFNVITTRAFNLMYRGRG